jgi:adenosine deaminase
MQRIAYRYRNQAGREFGIDVRLIVSMNRNESVEVGQEMMEIAIARQDRGVVGLDLTGNEADFPGAEFEPVFRKLARGWGSLSMPANGASQSVSG